MRGVAMRSSRSEPFGERFLREAMRLAMHGDTPALREHFLDTVAALRARRLPVADVATRVRLTKSPAAYRASRLREGQYEALLAAGRATWEPGARVRFYRAEGGRYALLPDDDRPRTAGQGAQHDEGALGGRRPMVGLPPYDAEHYVRVLVENYADRLRKAFRPADFAQIFRADAQLGLFDRDVAMIEPLWIRPAL